MHPSREAHRPRVWRLVETGEVVSPCYSDWVIGVNGQPEQWSGVYDPEVKLRELRVEEITWEGDTPA